MKRSYPLHHLLVKFSNFSSISAYYGSIGEVSFLLNSLCKASKKLWKDFSHPLSIKLREIKADLKYKKEFDEEIAYFLLENDTYLYYSLSVKLDGTS